MEDWQKSIDAVLETAAVAVEQFFQEVSQAIEDVAEEVHSEMATDFEQFWREFLEPLLEIDEMNLEPEAWEEPDFFLTPKIDPTADTHSACLGCRHYHGRVYGGQLLVCAMHPYGWEGSHCPDWEQG